MAESAEVVMARLEERMKIHTESMGEVIRELREQGHRSVSMEQRIQNVENSLTSQKPVIDDFITIKHKVVGAGQFGKWLWAFFAGGLVFMLTSREKIIAWMTGT